MKTLIGYSFVAAAPTVLYLIALHVRRLLPDLPTYPAQQLACCLASLAALWLAATLSITGSAILNDRPPPDADQ